MPSIVGAGWNLNIGGNVTRQINGICDDYQNLMVWHFAGNSPRDINVPNYIENGGGQIKSEYIGYAGYAWGLGQIGNLSQSVFPKTVKFDGSPNHQFTVSSSPNHLEALEQIKGHGFDSPDIFTVNFGEMSFSFIFEAVEANDITLPLPPVGTNVSENPGAYPLPFKVKLLNGVGYKIEIEKGKLPFQYFNTLYGLRQLADLPNPILGITKIKVTDKKGIRYEFENPEIISTQNILEISNHSNSGVNGNRVFQELLYNYSSNNWQISKIIFPNNEYIEYEYMSKEITEYIPIPRETFGEFLGYGHNLMPMKPYSNSLTKLPIKIKKYYVTKIKGISKNIDFSYTINNRFDMYNNIGVRLNKISVKSKIGSKIIQELSLKQSYVQLSNNLADNSTSDYEKKRLYLNGIRSLTEKLDFQFNYNNSSYFPPRNSRKQDLYGYFGNLNASEFPFPKLYICPDLPAGEKYRYSKPKNSITHYTMSGDNREPNASLLNNGLLNKIIFPTKGSVSIVYEPNTYYDAFAENKNTLGPGVRVQKLNFQDSSGSPLKSSSYLFSERNNTSGQLTNNPNYAYVTNWAINNEFDLSFHENHAYNIHDLLNKTRTEGEEIVTYHYLKNILTKPTDVIWKKLTKRSTTPYSSSKDIFGRAIIYKQITQENSNGENGKIIYKNFPIVNESLTQVIRVSGPSDEKQTYNPPNGYMTQTPVPARIGAFGLTIRSPWGGTMRYFKNWHNEANNTNHRTQFGLIEKQGVNIYPFPDRNYFKNINSLKSGKLHKVSILDVNNNTKQETTFEYEKTNGGNYLAVQGVHEAIVPARLYYSNNINNPVYIDAEGLGYSGLTGFRGFTKGVSSFYIHNYSTEIELKLKSSRAKKNNIEILSNYFYDNINHLQQTRIETHNSKGEVLTSVTKYAHDVDDLRLISENRIAEPIEMKTFKGDDQISHQKTIYDNNHNTNNQLYLPKTIQTSKGMAPLEDRIVYHKYDDKGNPVEISKKDGTHVVYIWGYNQTKLIAKIENFTYDELMRYNYNSGKAILSSIYSAANNDNDRTVDTRDSLGNVIAYNGKEGKLREALQDLRSALSNTQVTTYTYDPLIGVTSMTDPKGYTIYYEYDEFNRLKQVKDADGNMLSKNQYNYKN